MSELALELSQRLRGAAPDPAAIQALFDRASHSERVAATRALRRAEQRALYTAVSGFLPLGLEDLVPATADDWSEVRHFGTNTLPVFTRFEKRFCRPSGEDHAKPGALDGFNFHALARVIGPGYFVAVQDPNRCEVWIDYTHIPEDRPEHWPPLRSNERGLARFVYGGMVDTLRRVSEHVTIGSATRKGRDIGSWFVLVREG